jgi:D-beta-D-heptose 7-phosphate kinase/D-beta-D-heptose 1-phosphate adenosyltransferase
MIKRPITVFIAGGFDLFHDGHLYLLTEARKLGDRLIVAINHDSYFAKKGPGRPIDPLTKRIQNVLATGLVDQIHTIGDSPYEHIMFLKPDIITCGNDYPIEKVVGYKECAAWGGKVVLIPRIPGISTTQKIAQMEYDRQLEEHDTQYGNIHSSQR